MTRSSAQWWRAKAAPTGAGRSTRDRDAAIDWARGVLANLATVFLDTETTGKGATSDIVDIAIVDGKGQKLFDSLVRPSRGIPVEVSRIHGIYDEDVQNAPSWPEVFTRCVALIYDRPVVVYNAEFDREIILGCCERYRVGSLVADWHCAMLQFAAFVGEINPRFGDYRWHKLERAVTVFNGAPGGHRALGDALACRAVVVGMAASGA